MFRGIWNSVFNLSKNMIIFYRNDNFLWNIQVNRNLSYHWSYQKCIMWLFGDSNQSILPNNETPHFATSTSNHNYFIRLLAFDIREDDPVALIHYIYDYWKLSNRKVGQIIITQTAPVAFSATLSLTHSFSLSWGDPNASITHRERTVRNSSAKLVSGLLLGCHI